MAEGIVPPYLDDDHQRLRAHLRAAAESCKKAAEASTIEEVTKHIGAASMSLIDADFLRLKIAKEILKSDEEKN